MTVFFIVAALLVLAAVLFIVPPLLRKEPAQQLGAERRALNISIYQDQMKELGRELASDVITPEQYARSREELERRMLEDVSVPDQPAAARERDRSRHRPRCGAGRGDHSVLAGAVYGARHAGCARSDADGALRRRADGWCRCRRSSRR